MRWLSRLLIVLIVSLIAITLPSLPAQAQCGGPSIEVSPKYGLPGTNVTVEGQYFDPGKYADIYYDGTRITTGKTDSSGYFTLIFTVPEGCKGTHQVHVAVVRNTANAVFTVKPGLTVSPAEGPAGTNVTVKGQGFAKKEQGIQLMYYLNDNYKTVESRIMANAQGSWEISFQIPPSTSGRHKLDAQSTESKLYEVKDATFEVTAGINIDRLWDSAGNTITMTGSGFLAYEKNIQILFAGKPVVTDIKADSQGDWEETFEVPEMPAGNYSVTAEGEWTKKEGISGLGFEIRPDIVLSPAAGHVGTDVTVTGVGFAAGKNVSIMYDGGTVETTETDGQGSFEISFPAPESQHGEHRVAAGYSGQNAASATFTMESNHPDKPAVISPSNGSRVGLIGRRVTPTFEWSGVSDDSGVHYRLQIATSDDFAASFMIASVTGLTETNYTLDKALPYGTYYWIVQAVDGAQNESGWTAASSFRIGLLPLWAFIVIIVAVVVVLGVLIRARVRRRIIY